MAAMRVKYNKKRDTEINLQDAKAKEPPLTNDVVEIKYPSKQPTGPSAPKRLKKKHDPTVATTDPQLTKNNEELITAPPAVSKLPWDTYQKLFDLQLGDSDYFTVAEKKKPDPDKNPVIADGLLYLEDNDLEHGDISCSNTLVDPFGNVKLWGQEHIKTLTGACQHAKAVGEIIMYLAHGMARDDGIVGLDDPHRFPLAFDFLSATQTTSKIAAITDNPLLKLPWHKNRLAGLISLTHTWVGRGYRFPAVAADNICSVGPELSN
ncbi:hypothetical protein NQ176_g1366 [Zarea fungicola]|uniref:Uncharacterized protein n=1 Tax=Zarea fungicola TaxID=93591 RepID=A0ACC1NT44_9HYPO|nr:hypothetical protein NQ176_g1366 [Lecanicillium fungicola]